MPYLKFCKCSKYLAVLYFTFAMKIRGKREYVMQINFKDENEKTPLL